MSYLIENQVIEGFSLQLESPLVYGAYTDVLIALEAGKTYSVSWDGVLYICTAIDVSAYGNPGDVALGDVNHVFGGESTGEPFAIGYGQGYMDGVATGVFGNTWYSKTAESSHTVSVALYVEPEEEQEGIVLKDRNGDDVVYYGIETVTFDTTTEGKQQTYSKGVVAEGVEVTLALTDGDQVIQAADGYLVKEATIKKPDTLLAENIAEGVEIAGVTGTFEGNLLEDVPIELDFSQGDQTVTAPDGYSVKSAIIAKPENLKPDNIREGETVAGIPGAFAGGSPQSKAINFYDIYGNIVYSYTRAQATALTELPALPELEGYEAFKWSRTLDEVKSCQAFMDIGALYKKDGAQTSFLVLDVKAGDSIGLRTYVTYLSSGSTKSGTVYWGDGASSTITHTEEDTTVTVTHTYSNAGRYVIGLSTTDWLYLGSYASSSSASNKCITVNSSTSMSTRVVAVTFWGTYAGNYAMSYEYNLAFASFGSGSSTISSYCFTYCGKLKRVAMPSDALSWTSYSFNYCFALERLAGYSSSSLGFYNPTTFSDLLVGASASFLKGTSPKNLILTKASTVTNWTDINKMGLYNIYVPDDLVETYKSSYSAFSSYYKPLSEYPDY